MKSVEATLTQGERQAPFKLGSPDNDPLPKVTREPVLIDGDECHVICFRTGRSVGKVKLPTVDKAA